MMWVDTHCHLDAAEFAADRDAVYTRAEVAGMSYCVVPAVSVAKFPDVKVCATRYETCLAAYGIHPMYVDRAQITDLDYLDLWLKNENPIAVGEIGLDGTVVNKRGLGWDAQKMWFVEQLKLATKHNLPVILHVRRAIDEVIRALRAYPVKGGIAHAFNGSRQQAEVLIRLGFKLGFGGAMTYSGSTRIRQLARELPLSAIVLETDAPDIPPAWLDQNGLRSRNEPSELPAIAQVLADLRGVCLEEVLFVCTANARAVLALP